MPLDNLNYDMNDATTLSFVEGQLSHIEAKVYRKKYPNLQYPQLIPLDYSASDWAATVTYYAMGSVGQAEFISANGDDMPMVGLNKSQHESAVHMAGIGYGYNLQEVNQARMLRINLPSEEAGMARKGYEEFVDKSLMTGNAAKNMPGIINYPGIQIVAAPNGAGGSPLWTLKTADEILLDINNLLAGVYIDSLTVEIADTILMSETDYLAISNKRIPGTTMTLLAYIMANNILKMRYNRELKITTVRGLENAGGGGVSRVVAYRKDEEVLKAHIPMPFRFLPMQTRLLQYIVPGLFRFGGLEIRIPGAVRYLDGVG